MPCVLRYKLRPRTTERATDGARGMGHRIGDLVTARGRIRRHMHAARGLNLRLNLYARYYIKRTNAGA